MDNNHIRIAGVSERDTDLLFLEEFMASFEFVEYFLRLLGLSDDNWSFLEASRSVTDSTGESDLEIILKNKENLKFALMLENKVNAGFQPKQAERYKQRGVNYVKQGKITGFATVLIAPEIYFSGDTKGFDHRINYETLMNWFENSDIRAGRKKYKTYLLKSAIEKSSIGYQMVEDAVVSVFWRDYWLLVSNIAPEFCMAEPAKKPAGSWFIYFNQVGLPKNVKLVHKLVNGCFDIQFNGMGDRVSEIILMYKDKLLPNMQIVKAAKSASIRVKVPELTAADSLEVQKEKAIEAIHSGKKLLEWYKTISI